MRSAMKVGIDVTVKLNYSIPYLSGVSWGAPTREGKARDLQN